MAKVSTANTEPCWVELPAPLELRQPDFAWSKPGLTLAAVGEAARCEGESLLEVLRELQRGPVLPGAPGPWFGAAAFPGPMGASWSGFSPLSFKLPALLAWSRDGKHFAAAFGTGARERLERARHAAEPLRLVPAPPEVTLVAQPGERARWTRLVEDALAGIRGGKISKAVVARAVDLECSAPLEPQALLRALAARHPTCRSFLIRGSGGAAFLGATPELLCSVEGDRVRTEALAGSAAPGEGAALLRSDKDLREHAQVVEHILARLRPLSRSIHAPADPELLELPNVVHLRTPIEARLASGRTAADVAAALHPTPAVCGAPQAAAREFLAQHEPLERGLYAGLVGEVGPDHAELAVSLRCALVRGNRVRLFVGAGIVEGSQPDAEWEETALKARALLGALGAAP